MIEIGHNLLDILYTLDKAVTVAAFRKFLNPCFSLDLFLSSVLFSSYYTQSAVRIELLALPHVAVSSTLYYFVYVSKVELQSSLVPAQVQP